MKMLEYFFFFHELRTEHASNQTVKGLSQYCALYEACLHSLSRLHINTLVEGPWHKQAGVLYSKCIIFTHQAFV